MKLTKIMVSEAGASPYSASRRRRRVPEAGRVPARRVSIARRLQDPLASLVKIDPVDRRRASTSRVSQLKLARSLDAVVEGLRERRQRRRQHRLRRLLAHISVPQLDAWHQNIVAARDANWRSPATS